VFVTALVDDRGALVLFDAVQIIMDSLHEAIARY
jgi:hypothetical protein